MPQYVSSPHFNLIAAYFNYYCYSYYCNSLRSNLVPHFVHCRRWFCGWWLKSGFSCGRWREGLCAAHLFCLLPQISLQYFQYNAGGESGWWPKLECSTQPLRHVGCHELRPRSRIWPTGDLLEACYLSRTSYSSCLCVFAWDSWGTHHLKFAREM